MTIKNKLLFYLSCHLLLIVYCLRSAYAGTEQYYGKFYSDGPSGTQEFALTYDDGPGFITGDLLKLLEKYGVKATFFMTGAAVRKDPKKAAAAAAAGHLLGNHTDTHADYLQAGKGPDPEKFLEKELAGAASIIEKATGKRTFLLRMPYGYDRAWVRKAAARQGYILVNWTYGSDWSKSGEEAMTEGYLKNVKPGAILLMHDGGGASREKTLRITEKVILEAARKGLKPVRLDELLGIGDADD